MLPAHVRRSLSVQGPRPRHSPRLLPTVRGPVLQEGRTLAPLRAEDMPGGHLVAKTIFILRLLIKGCLPWSLVVCLSWATVPRWGVGCAVWLGCHPCCEHKACRSMLGHVAAPTVWE